MNWHLYIALFPVPGPTPTMYPIGSMAYRQAVQQFDQSSNFFRSYVLVQFFLIIFKTFSS